MVHQHFKLVECFSVLDNIILGVEPNKMGFLQKQEARKKVIDLSEKYGLHVDPAHRAEYTFRTFADEAYRLRLERKALGAL